jgi:hypothetical protein
MSQAVGVLPDFTPFPHERRRDPRFNVGVTVTIDRVNADDGEPVVEHTITDDLGPGGARVPVTRLAIGPGDVVMLEVPDVFAVSAAVRAISFGSDNVPRVGLAFLEEEAADHVWRILQDAGLA